MSAAASIPHRLPGHPVLIPRVLIHNLALLVPAEERFALLLYARMDREECYVPMSDLEWTRHSGLDPRSKELAIRGLKNKGLLLTEGLGGRARYCTDTRGFMRWASQADRSRKPRTAGRGVTIKPGAKVHPECAGGCMMLRQDCTPRETGFAAVTPGNSLHVVNETVSVSPAAATKEMPFAKPVSRPDDDNSRRPRHLKRRLAAAKPKHPAQHEVAPSRLGPVNAGASGSGSKPAGHNRVQPAGPSPAEAACMEAMEQEQAAKAWPLALARLALCRPAVGLDFLIKLLAAVVRCGLSGVTDAELAGALKQAAAHKRNYQQSVGLFLKTVPEMLIAMRRERRDNSPPASPESLLVARKESLAAMRASPDWDTLTPEQKAALLADD